MEKSKKYYLKNKEKLKRKSREYHQKNKDLISQKRKEKYKNNIGGARDKALLRENPNYFNCLERDNWTCQICEKPNEKLIVHHINSNRQDNELNNLMAVCYRCHQMITWFNVLNIRSSKIGCGTFIEPMATIQNAQIGKNGIIRKFANIYESKIGNNVKIGAYAEIGKAKIGSNCKIEAYSFIPGGIEIENDCFIGPKVCFTNDKYPPSGNWLPTLVKKGAVIGAGVVVLPGIIIGKKSTIGAGAVITKSVPDGEVWVGNPAHKI